MLACSQISVAFGEAQPVLHDVSLCVEPGSVLGVIGTNGCGKTTLARCLSGASAPTAGAVLLDGRPVGVEELRSEVGMVYQQPERQLFAKTAFEDVCFGPLNDGCTEEEAAARAEAALQELGLDCDQAKVTSPFCYSGGQRRRLALAGVLALQTPYIVMDESDAGLDGRSIETLEETIASLACQGRGVVVIGHDLAFVGRVADKVALLFDGHLLSCDTPERVMGDAELLEAAGLQVPALAGLVNSLNAKAGVSLRYAGDTSQLAAEIADLCQVCWR